MTRNRVWVYNSREVCSFLMDDAAETPSHSCHPACLCSAYTVLSAEPDTYVQTNWSIPLNNSWLSWRAWQQDTNYQDSSPALSIIISGGWSISETIAHLPHSVVASCERLSLASVVLMSTTLASFKTTLGWRSLLRGSYDKPTSYRMMIIPFYLFLCDYMTIWY